MTAWTSPSSPDGSGVQRSLCEVIAAVGKRDFARVALEAINSQVSAGSWSVYRLFGDRAPMMHLSASRQLEDTTQRCFAAYCDRGLYRRDRSFDSVRTAGRPGYASVLRMHADEAPNADHRDKIYLRHGMLERLSIARLEADGSLLALNLYHHTHQGPFSAAEAQRFADLAPLLLASVSRHVEWQGGVADVAVRDRLRMRCEMLTERELDVLERLLRGMSYDGIAADMGLGVASVKTYRARAFARLDMHFKSELFAAFLT